MQKTYTDIPLTRPETPILDTIGAPVDLRGLSSDELVQLADE